MYNNLVFHFLFIQELIEKLNKGELPKEDYQSMNNPSPSSGPPQGGSVRSGRTSVPSQGGSVRSRRTATWARSRASDDGYSRYEHLAICTAPEEFALS